MTRSRYKKCNYPSSLRPCWITPYRRDELLSKILNNELDNPIEIRGRCPKLTHLGLRPSGVWFLHHRRAPALRHEPLPSVRRLDCPCNSRPAVVLCTGSTIQLMEFLEAL